MSAFGKDENNQIFSIVYAIVDSGNTDIWRWFTELLSADLDLVEGRGYNIIGDQHKGLEKALTELIPNVKHILCARHLYINTKRGSINYISI